MSQRLGTQGMDVGTGQAERDPAPRPWFRPNEEGRVPAERGNDAQRQISVLGGHGKREGGAQVGARGCEAGGDLKLVRLPQRVGEPPAKPGVVVGMAADKIRRLALSGQPFGTVLAQRLQQPEGGRVTHVGEDH
jgi:hypothetical protein